MISTMIFAGCSYTWGQSLHLYGEFNDDRHPQDGFYYEESLLPHHYQYNVDNRFATKVSDYFGRKPIVCARNGNSNPLMIDWIYGKLKENPNTDCIIVQTTSFARGYNQHGDDNKQIQAFNELIKFVEERDILIRFIHMDLGGEHGGIELSDEIKSRTILYDGKLHFFHTMLVKNGSRDYRVVGADFGTSDTHFNLVGHQYLTKIIIEELEKSNYENVKKIGLPKLIKNKIFNKHDFDSLLDFVKDSDKKQYLLYSTDKNNVAYDEDLTDNNLINHVIEKLQKFKLLNIWLMKYPPNYGLGYHQDATQTSNRYVYELQSADNSFFEFFNYNKISKIENINDDILYIGNTFHDFKNNSKTNTRISLVFDTKIKLTK